MKLALVYDRVNKFGGAERVLLALHQIWPEAPLYTSVYDPGKAPWAAGFTIRPSFLNRLSFFRDKHEWLAPLMPYAFEAFDLSAYDVVLSVTSAEAKSVITKANQLHLCYLLTPTRYLWSHAHQYLNTRIKKVLMSGAVSALRRFDYIAAARPDYFIPISAVVSKRLVKYYRRQPEPVIYPPVDIAKFKCHPEKCFTKLRDYYLVVARPVNYKRTNLVIDTFSQLTDKQLVIIGDHQPLFRQRNIISLGSVSDDQLACYYHHAKALIFPQEEDFGLTAVEAQAAGKPVIAFRGGGALETVIEGQTGLFFDEPTVTCLASAIKTSETKNWYDKLIFKQSERFNTARFQHEMLETVEGLWEKHRDRQ